MARTLGLSSAGLALVALVALSVVSMSAGPANAVVYCKTVGVPRGCVARPVAHPAVWRRLLMSTLSIAKLAACRKAA